MTITAQKIANLKQEIIRMEKELSRLEKESLLENQVDPKLKEIATILHELFCHWNHTDGCGWYYRTDADFMSDTSYDRSSYYKWATNITKNIAPEVVINVLNTIKSNKK